ARRWDERHGALLGRSVRPHENDRSPTRRLRVGYVSPNFHIHPIAFFLEGMLREHSADEVETFCYSASNQIDRATARLQEHAHALASDADPFYSEKLVRLPETFVCFSPGENAPAVEPPPSEASGQVTFASFHKLAKLNEELLSEWATVLQRVPRSRLMLVSG